MVASSLCLAFAGLVCLFVPSQLPSLLGLTNSSPVLVQVSAALYLGFAGANWTARGSMIGGIYARPLSVANFFHFFVGGTVLVTADLDSPMTVAYVAVVIVYLLFAILFADLLFGRRLHRGKEAKVK